MDEYIDVSGGRCIRLKGEFVDNNLIQWIGGGRNIAIL